MQRLFNFHIGTRVELPCHFWARAFDAVVLEVIKDVRYKSDKLFKSGSITQVCAHIRKLNITIVLSVISKLVAQYLEHGSSSLSSLTAEFRKACINNVKFSKA